MATEIRYERLIDRRWRATLGEFSMIGATKGDAMELLIASIAAEKRDCQPIVKIGPDGDAWILYRTCGRWCYFRQSAKAGSCCMMDSESRDSAHDAMVAHMAQYYE